MGRSVKDFADETSLWTALSLPESGNEAEINGTESSTRGLWQLEGNYSHNEGYPDWFNPEAVPGDAREQTVNAEFERLLYLKSFHILEDLEQEQSQFNLDHFSTLARRLFNVMMSFTTIIDLGRCLFLGKDGLELDADEVPRRNTFCSHAILYPKDDIYEVRDAQEHSVFKDYPTVKAGYVRFYAAYPLTTPGGHRLGVFTVVDSNPRPSGLSSQEKMDLKMLGDAVLHDIIRQKDLLSAQKIAEKSLADKAKIAHNLVTPLTGFELAYSSLDSSQLESTPPDVKEFIVTATDCIFAVKETMESIREKVSSDTTSVCQQRRSTEKKTALVIDDSIVVRKSMCKALQNLGFEVNCGADGEAGLLLLKLQLFDIVFCDFLMPKLDGFDCVRLFREWEASNRPAVVRQEIIGISAHASKEDIDLSISLGMDAHLQKPIGIDTLRSLSERIDSTGMSAVAVLREAFDCLLIVEDETQRSQIKAMVENLRWSCTTASSRKEAYEMIQSRNWTAVLVDCEFFTNEKSGLDFIGDFRRWEICNRIRKQESLILLCTDAMTFGRCSETSLGAFGVPHGETRIIGKPVSESVLRRTLEAAALENSVNGGIIIR